MIPVTRLAASAHRQHGQASRPSTRCTAYTAAHNFLARPANASASTSANGDLVPSADQPHHNSSTAYRRQSSTPATVSNAQNHETLLPPPLNTYSQNNHTARSRLRPPKCSRFHRLTARHKPISAAPVPVYGVETSPVSNTRLTKRSPPNPNTPISACWSVNWPASPVSQRPHRASHRAPQNTASLRPATQGVPPVTPAPCPHLEHHRHP